MKNNLTILPGCITCGLCESLAPEVFAVTDVARVKPEAPIAPCLQAVKQAVAECPVQVIHLSCEEIE